MYDDPWENHEKSSVQNSGQWNSKEAPSWLLESKCWGGDVFDLLTNFINETGSWNWIGVRGASSRAASSESSGKNDATRFHKYYKVFICSDDFCKEHKTGAWWAVDSRGSAKNPAWRINSRSKTQFVQEYKCEGGQTLSWWQDLDTLWT